MKIRFPTGINHLQFARFATFISALLFVFGLTLAFWAATTPVAQAAQPFPTPSSPTPTPGIGHQECTVCHNPQHHPITLTIDCHALRAHLAHGDYEGPCRSTPTPTPNPTPKPTPPGKDKCEVCHNPHNYHTVSIPCDQVDKFIQNHPGDYRGPCHVTTATNQ